jgi:hypothetical protein
MISTDVLIGQDTILARRASRRSDDHDLRVPDVLVHGLPGRRRVRHRLAAAVALDASIVRTVLVPAEMRLFGDAN